MSLVEVAMHKPRLAEDSPAEGARPVIERELDRAKQAKSKKETEPKALKPDDRR